MLTHLVFFKFDPKLENKFIEQKIMLNLLKMKDSIKEIKEISWHYNSSVEDLKLGFFYMLRVIFENQDAFNTYLTHQAHVDVVEKYLIPNLEDKKDHTQSIIVFDY